MALALTGGLFSWGIPVIYESPRHFVVLVLEQRKENVVLGHRKRGTDAFARLVPKKHYQCFS